MKGERPLFHESQLVSERTRQLWHSRIEFLNEHVDDLNDWESDFLESIEMRLANGKDLTLGQSSKLNEVYHRIEEVVG